MLKKIKNIYQWEKTRRMPRKLSKTSWKRSKYTRLKNLTVQFWLIKVLLARKIQFKEKNSKLDI